MFSVAMLPDTTGTNHLLRAPLDRTQQDLMYLHGRMDALQHEFDLLQGTFIILGFALMALLGAFLLKLLLDRKK